MARLRIEPYSANQRQKWDAFVKNARNGSFLLQRDFMEYHADRFADFSLLVYRNNKLVALLPANRQANQLVSHQGLTYGGLIVSPKLKFDRLLAVFKTLLQFLEQENIRSLILKPSPKIYHTSPTDEIDYLLFLLKAKLIKRELSAAIYQPHRLKIQSNRMEGVKKAQTQGLTIKKETVFTPFWETILVPNLKKTHNASPVHTVEEIKSLARSFPQHIHQFNVYKDRQIVGGTTIFETDQVAHTQYISANEDKQTLGTLDFLFDHLINKEFSEKAYFDFGTSNENEGQQINGGLLYWKECFGARGIAYDTYAIDPTLHPLLDKVFV